jgi:hypothetical protein
MSPIVINKRQYPDEKIRKKIKLDKDGIAPVTRGFWFHAYEKLREASMGIEAMTQSKDQVTYEKGWRQFVDCIEQFWHRFYQEGKNNFPKFETWSGKYIHQRKTDQLLKYLIHSRHLNQHGNLFLEWKPTSLQIDPIFGGIIQNISFDGSDCYEITSESMMPGTEANLIHKTGRPELPLIVNKKFNQNFPPPESHLNEPLLNREPKDVSILAFQYYNQLFEKAKNEFTK